MNESEFRAALGDVIDEYRVDHSSVQAVVTNVLTQLPVRRRRRRIAQAAVLAVVLLTGGVGWFVASGGSTPDRGPAGQSLASGAKTPAAPAGIPWKPLPPHRTPVTPPPTAPACTAAQLSLTLEHGTPWGGAALLPVDIRNVSGAPCSLQGWPTAVLNGTTTAGHGLNYFHMVAGPLPPGQQTQAATIAIAVPFSCPGFSSLPAKLLTTAVITLPNGATFAIPHMLMDARCGPPTVSPLGVPPEDTFVPDRLQALQVSMSVPGTITAGQVLSYTITLTNPTTQPVSLTPCPSYTQSILAGTLTRESYGLNCAGLTSLAAGQSVTFQMRFAIPATAHPGWAKFGWTVDPPNGPITGRLVQVVAP